MASTSGNLPFEIFTGRSLQIVPRLRQGLGTPAGHNAYAIAAGDLEAGVFIFDDRGLNRKIRGKSPGRRGVVWYQLTIRAFFFPLILDMLVNKKLDIKKWNAHIIDLRCPCG